MPCFYMVKKETIKLKPEVLDLIRGLIAEGALERASNGAWRLVVKIEGEIQIDETRTLDISCRRSFAGIQSGRKA